MDNKAGKSIIPPRLQIPVAVVLGILFILLLGNRLKAAGIIQRANAADEPEQPQAVPTERIISLDPRIDSLIDQFNEVADSKSDEPAPPARLTADPFAEPDEITREEPSGDGRPSNRPGSVTDLIPRIEFEHRKREREDFIQSMRLQGTLVDGSTRLAVIDGKLFAENDSLGAFKIERIEERSVLLSDDIGSELLEMKGY